MGGRLHETSIGLEVHVQLDTRTKLFCSCAPRFGDPPNSHLCPTCLGLPGALPVLDAAAVDAAVRVASALGCRVHRRSRFTRKSYLYPDLPKGYQITQHRMPLATGGAVAYRHGGARRHLSVERLHVEEDAGRLLHVDGGRPGTRVDLNRCGVPLVEIVTAPASLGPAEAVAGLRALRDLVRWSGVTDARMEEGSLRCDANISVRPEGQAELNPKTELKNLNSFRLLRKALRHEETRQRRMLEEGFRPGPSTRRWDPTAGRTVVMRGKESNPDYRYFPEPDLPELEIDEARIRRSGELPELPPVRADRYVASHRLDRETAERLVRDRGRAEWFEATVEAGADPAAAARWLLGPVQALANERAGGAVEELRLAPDAMAELLQALAEGVVSENLAREVLERVVETGRAPRAIIDADDRRAIHGDRALGAAVDRVLREHPEEASRCLAGEERLLEWFMGQVMRATDGRAEPGRARALLEDRLAGDER